MFPYLLVWSGVERNTFDKVLQQHTKCLGFDFFKSQNVFGKAEDRFYWTTALLFVWGRDPPPQQRNRLAARLPLSLCTKLKGSAETPVGLSLSDLSHTGLPPFCFIVNMLLFKHLHCMMQKQVAWREVMGVLVSLLVLYVSTGLVSIRRWCNKSI